jgi:hypothetical protein
MVRGSRGSRQKLKHRFRKLTTSSTFENNHIATEQQKNNDSSNQVSTLLEKLRNEARFNNDQTSTSLSHTLPQPAFNYFMREHAEREQQERGEREIMRQRISGLAPPWRISWQDEIGKNGTELLIKDRKEKRRAWDGEEIRTTIILYFKLKDFDLVLRRNACFFS